MQNKETYLDTVCSEIKFRAARKVLRQELEDHIEDRKSELAKSGAPDAESAAIKAMGDAKETGKALNAIHKPRTEWGVIICVLLLSAAGIAAAYAGTGYPYDDYGQGLWPYIQSFLPLFLSLGICLMIGMVLVNYTMLFRLRHVFLGIAFLAVAVYALYFTITSFTPPYRSNAYWLSYLTVFSLPFFILGAAGCINRNKDTGIKGTIRTTILGVVSAFAISLFSPEFSLLFALSYVVMMFANTYNSTRQKRWRHFTIATGIIAGILVPYLIFALTYTGTSNGTEINNIFTVSRYSYQMIQNTLQSANFIGASPQLIQSQELSSYGSSTAYIITTVISAYGWLAAAAIVLAFLALFAFMIRRSLKIADPFGRLLASGITSLFFVRFAISILSGTIFPNGLYYVLPFLGCGSSLYLVDALLMGVFLSVWRRSSFMTTNTPYVLKKKRAAIKAES